MVIRSFDLIGAVASITIPSDFADDDLPVKSYPGIVKKIMQ